MPDIRQKDIDAAFLTGPGEVLVPKFLAAMSAVPAFANIFGALKDKEGKFKSWADYARTDWSLRELPCVNIYESGNETKASPNGYIDGSIMVQVFWPPSFRRSDMARIPVAFKAALQNFLESSYVFPLLDPGPEENVDTKVPGLNRLSQTNWAPNTEGIIADELVPVTMVEVQYRVDLRGWYRFLTTDGRTKELPFSRTLADFDATHGIYDGVKNIGDQIPQVELIQDVDNINP